MNLTFDFDTVKRKAKITSEFLPAIREVFSAEDTSSVFMRRRRGGNMPIRKYAITGAGYFDYPFHETIEDVLRVKFPALNITKTDTFLNKCETISINDEIIKLKLEPRDYQFESATKAVQKGRGIIVLPTSAGKTLVVGMIANTFNRITNKRVIILVPNLQLVQQTYKDFLEYGINEEQMSIWTGNNDYTPTNIVIANYQILLSEKQNSEEILKTFECCIVDECHKIASADKITKLIKKINFKHIFGFTGSLPINEYDVWSINRVFGQALYKKQSIDLREQKYISKVQIATIKIEYTNIPQFTIPSMDNPTAGYEEEITWLQTHNFRNKIIAKLVNKLQTNTLILVDRIIHGEHLLEFLSNHTDKQIYFVQGSVEVEEREKIRTLMESTNNIVCVAISKIFSTGISIKNLHNVIFAAIGKARIKIIQSIGRSLRLHHSKDVATIFDVADINLRYGFKHYREREQLYISEKIPVTSREIVEI
jgi:superfamily II DNA or RNA helicase